MRRPDASSWGTTIRRVRLTLPLLAMVVVSLFAPVEREASGPLDTSGGANIDVYRGLGTWVDLYDESAWKNPRATVEAIKARGVRTLFLETSNFDRTSAFVFPEKVQEFVDAAHELGVGIVAWYLPGFDDVSRDFDRSIAAIRYTTPAGNSFDSFGLDIESPQVKSPSLRTARLLDLSSRLREAAGNSYPLGAVIPSPKGMQSHPKYWPGFPYQELASTYDVFLPMTYFTWRVSDLQGAHDYTATNIDIIRRETAGATVPIHVIGGIADSASTWETMGFVRAVRERGVIGASYYTFPLVRPAQWPTLSTIPTNPTENPPLPLQLGSPDALGNIPGGDQTHPKEVFYRTVRKTGSWNLTYQVFDAQQGEVEIWVNWRDLGPVPATADGAWSETLTQTIPAAFLHNDAPNYVAFVAGGNYPTWSEWGVRTVALSRAPSPTPTPTPSASPP